MKYKERKSLGEQTDQKLLEQLEQLRKDLFSFKLQQVNRQLGQTHIVKETRASIARITMHLHMRGKAKKTEIKKTEIKNG